MSIAGQHFTIRAGVAFLYDFAAFAQDAASKEQIAMLPGKKVRDVRFLTGGRLPSIKLPTPGAPGSCATAP
jgi:hypothetical protein